MPDICTHRGGPERHIGSAWDPYWDKILELWAAWITTLNGLHAVEQRRGVMQAQRQTILPGLSGDSHLQMCSCLISSQADLSCLLCFRSPRETMPSKSPEGEMDWILGPCMCTYYRSPICNIFSRT